MFPSGDSDILLYFVPIFFFFFLTALRGFLRGFSHSFGLFFTICNYFYTVLVCFKYVIENSPFFQF